MGALIIGGLAKIYGKGASACRAVDGLSLNLPQGTVLGLLGPNGSGKTTTVKCAASILDYDGGSIAFDGLDPRRNRARYLSRLGAVLEGARNVHWRLCARENMEYFAGLRGMGRKDARGRAAELAARLGLEPVMNTLVGRLSRGNQQRVALACALMHRPQLLLLDEPTLGLDVGSVEAVRSLIPALARDGAAVLVTSHDMHLIEAVCDKVAVVRSGAVIADGSPASLRALFGAHSLRVRVPASGAERMSGILPGAVRSEDEDGHALFSMQADSATAALELAAAVHRAGVPVADVELGRPSLEDAFKQLVTGQPAKETAR